MAGCGGSPSNSTTGSSGGSGSGGASANTSSPACGGAGYGYNNQNGTITGVWLQSPSPGANPSQVQVNATAFASDPVTMWTVCLDDQAVYQTNNAVTSISQPISVPPGEHFLYAHVRDAKGDSNRSEVELIQVGPPPPSSTVLPTPPANAQVLTEMQNDTATWGICSLCAHGTNTTGTYQYIDTSSSNNATGFYRARSLP